jgi:hypothetical protein
MGIEASFVFGYGASARNALAFHGLQWLVGLVN